MTRSATLPSPPVRKAPPRWALLAVLAAALAIAVGAGIDRWRDSAEPAELDLAAVRPGYGPKSFAEARAAADVKVTGAREGLAAGPDEWLRGEVLAAALVGRWRLEGDYTDLVEAERILAQGVAQTSDPAGPVLTQAMLAVMVHKLDLADLALTRFSRAAAPETGELADAATLAGDIALQRGNSREAARRFAVALKTAPTAGVTLRLAMLDAQLGNPGRAAIELEKLIGAPRQSPAQLAATMLQRAQLAYRTGDWAGAGRWVGAAQRAFPGWWLADAHAAQQFALAGRTDEAIRAYTIVAERSQRPEVMDALAHLLRLEGRGDESRAWAVRSAALWQARATLFPEAVIQHRAEHELAVGSLPAALKLAEADVAARPGAPGIALLARALILSGRPREALGWLDRAQAAGFVSAGLLLLRADALAALGAADASNSARRQALAINPRAADPAARLVWFGHD